MVICLWGEVQLYRAYSANKVSTEVSYPDDLDVQLIVRWKESSVDSPIARESGKE